MNLKTRKMKSRHSRHRYDTKRGGGPFDAVKNAAAAAAKNAAVAAESVKNAAAAAAAAKNAAATSLVRSAKSLGQTIADGGGRLSQLNLIMLAFTPEEFRIMKAGIVRMGGCDPNDKRFISLVNATKSASNSDAQRDSDASNSNSDVTAM